MPRRASGYSSLRTDRIDRRQPATVVRMVPALEAAVHFALQLATDPRCPFLKCLANRRAIGTKTTHQKSST